MEELDKPQAMLNKYLSSEPEDLVDNYKLDETYEYKQMEFSGLTIEVMRQTPDSPKTVAMRKFIEETMPERGWEMYEICHPEKLIQIRRYRRKLEVVAP